MFQGTLIINYFIHHLLVYLTALEVHCSKLVLNHLYIQQSFDLFLQETIHLNKNKGIWVSQLAKIPTLLLIGEDHWIKKRRGTL